MIEMGELNKYCLLFCFQLSFAVIYYGPECFLIFFY